MFSSMRNRAAARSHFHARTFEKWVRNKILRSQNHRGRLGSHSDCRAVAGHSRRPAARSPVGPNYLEAQDSLRYRVADLFRRGASLSAAAINRWRNGILRREE